MKNIVKEARVHGMWKQGELAARLGISISHLSLIENNKRTPSLEIALEIAEVLFVPVEELWTK
jgi:DNA-binding XRE family transcriptional regulator